MSPSKQPDRPKYLLIKQIAARLGENPHTVKGWVRRKLFPNARKVSSPRGDYWEIPETDLEAFERPKLGRPKDSTADAKVTPKRGTAK